MMLFLKIQLARANFFAFVVKQNFLTRNLVSSNTVNVQHTSKENNLICKWKPTLPEPPVNLNIPVPTPVNTNVNVNANTINENNGPGNVWVNNFHFSRPEKSVLARKRSLQNSDPVKQSKSGRVIEV